MSLENSQESESQSQQQQPDPQQQQQQQPDWVVLRLISTIIAKLN